jgi:pathogen-inducible salicylic acid glucosyltransferase
MSVNSIYYHVHKGELKVPLINQDEISLPLLPRFEVEDMPSFFLTKEGENQVLLDMLVGQFSNIHKADWILCNTFYEMEKEVHKIRLRSLTHITHTNISPMFGLIPFSLLPFKSIHSSC